MGIVADHLIDGVAHGLITFQPDDDHFLDLFTAVTASTGWWWALPNVCVMADRPVAMHTEPIPGNYRRTTPAPRERSGGRIRGWSHHFRDSRHHRAAMVVTDPTAKRIRDERNVEIRRTAIERIGWDTYIDATGLTLLDAAHDPGNPGCTLRLYGNPHKWIEDFESYWWTTVPLSAMAADDATDSTSPLYF